VNSLEPGTGRHAASIFKIDSAFERIHMSIRSAVGSIGKAGKATAINDMHIATGLRLHLNVVLLLIAALALPYQSARSEVRNVDKVYVSGDTIRPHLYLNLEKIGFIRSKLQFAPYSKFWKFVKAKADQYTNEPVTSESMRKKDIRSLGDRLPFMAMAYLITGQDPYVTATRRLMNMLVSFTDWDGNRDLGAAHLLFGMSVAYDWLYSKWTEAERERFRVTMTEHANALYHALVNKEMWWARREYLLQNHNYTNVMAFAVAGEALRGEVPQADAWLTAAEQNFRSVLELLSPDGASHEGIGYWGYGTEAMLKYFLVLPGIDGKRAIENSSFFRNTARFRLYASLPGYVENVDFADSPRTEWYGPGYILRALASIFRDGHAQWLAERIEQARGQDALYSWLDLIWYDESVKPQPPYDLPPYAYFDNLGIFFGRSDWTDRATWTFFKAGPSQGRLGESKRIYTGSHIHPDEGSFLLWANGKWLIVDDGYVNKKRTSNHNVLLFGGKGQLGEGKEWFDPDPVKKNKGTAEVVYVDLQPEYQYLVADIGAMYPPEAGVRTWSRTFIFLPPGKLVIRDKISWRNPGQIVEGIHLSRRPALNSPSSACLGTDTGVVVVDAYPKNALLSVGEYRVDKKERTRTTNSVGGLIGVKAQDVNAMILAFDVNGDCKNYGGQFVASPSGSRLEIHGGQRPSIIDFERKKVIFE
jgi:hypothetical protein